MTTATTTTHEAARAVLEFARRSTLKMVDDIPTEKFCSKPLDGANHALWVLGHLAVTDDWFACTIGNRESVIDESWGPLFGMKSEPSEDPSTYPSIDEIKAGLERARQSLLTGFESLDEQQLQGPVPDELEGFAPNVGGAAFTLAWHEGFHAGQLSAVRRSLGLPLTMG